MNLIEPTLDNLQFVNVAPEHLPYDRAADAERPDVPEIQAAASGGADRLLNDSIDQSVFWSLRTRNGDEVSREF